MITVHLEALPHLHRAVIRIKELGAKAGVAINPATPVSSLAEIVDELDHVLVMSVNPGFTGQRFIPNSLRKVEAVRDLMAGRGSRAAIEVDGGVDAGNAAGLVRAGASILVAGAAIFHTEDASGAVQSLRRAAAAGRA